MGSWIMNSALEDIQCFAQREKRVPIAMCVAVNSKTDNARYRVVHAHCFAILNGLLHDCMWGYHADFLAPFISDGLWSVSC